VEKVQINISLWHVAATDVEKVHGFHQGHRYRGTMPA
jgi:hypothetical protein